MDSPRTLPYYIYGKECNNFSRLSRLITEVCTDLIRILFSKHIPPDDLITTLKTKSHYLKQKLNQDQKKMIYQNGNTVHPSLTTKDLDISAMVKILRRLRYVSEKRDIRIADYVKIISDWKNSMQSHTTNGRVEDGKFKTIWKELKSAVIYIEEKLIGGDLFQRAVEYLYSWNNDQHENRSMQAPGDTSDESEGTHYDDMGARVRFTDLFEELAQNIPQDKLEQMKDVIKNSSKGVNTVDIKKASSARTCLNILNETNHFTSTDVIYIQYVLKKIGCGGLHAKCFEYAKNQNALCFHETTLPEAGGQIVHIHVPGNLENYDQSFINKIIQAVADIVGCSIEEIQLGGICPSNSFLVGLSLKTAYLRRLLTMDQQDKDTLTRLNIDYILADLNVIFLERSKDLEEKSIMYFGAKTKSRCTDMNWKGGHAYMPTPKQKSTELLTQSYTSTEKDLKKKLDESPTESRLISPESELSAVVISTIDVPDVESINHITYLKPKLLWVGCINSKKENIINQVDLDGNVMKTINETGCLHGKFAVTQNGDLLYVAKGGHTVQKNTEKSIIIQTSEHEIIESILSSEITGDILVGIQVRVEGIQRNGKLIRYDENGNKIEDFEAGKEEKAQYSRPIYIAENKKKDIVIADATKNRVVLLNKLGIYQNSYKGQTPYKKSFKPRGISTDEQCQILVVDHEFSSVHLLDHNLNFLTILLTSEKHDLKYPSGICLDDKHNLYVGCEKGKINVYMYLLDSLTKYKH